tara:strand:+ start:8926 stop:9513 length:588 start_codon:yes stop_codon:yes gene_type:complete
MNVINKLANDLASVKNDMTALRKSIVDLTVLNKRIYDSLNDFDQSNLQFQLEAEYEPEKNENYQIFEYNLNDFLSLESIDRMVNDKLLPKSDYKKVITMTYDKELSENTKSIYFSNVTSINNHKKVFYAFILMRQFGYSNETVCEVMVEKLGIDLINTPSKANLFISAAKNAKIIRIGNGRFYFNTEFKSEVLKK